MPKLKFNGFHWPQKGSDSPSNGIMEYQTSKLCSGGHHSCWLGLLWRWCPKTIHKANWDRNGKSLRNCDSNRLYDTGDGTGSRPIVDALRPLVDLLRQIRHPLATGAHYPAVRAHRLSQHQHPVGESPAGHHHGQCFKLKERSENRMVVAPAAATGDYNPLSQQ